MGKVVGFPIGDRHVGVERIARKIYLATKDYERQKAMAFQRAENMLERATDAGVPEDVAFDQATRLAAMIGWWIDEIELEERAPAFNGDAA